MIMATKNFNFFKQFEKQMELCVKAADQLVDLLEDYTDIHKKAKALHDTEHKADDLCHELMQELNAAFVTPIDREDIVELGNSLDDIIDSIEDISNSFDIMSIEEVKPEAKEISILIQSGCKALSELVTEFPQFKKSKKMNRLGELVIKVNNIEADGDTRHRSILKDMFRNEKDAIELIKWKEIFDTMEEVLDNTESVANLLDGLIIKNS
jgi:predicted phosphate transport protein (TIGR00153 family)